MSMLTAQCERLRKVADDLDFYTITRDIYAASMLMREAADTIDELRSMLQETCRNVDANADAGGEWHSPRFVCSECGAVYVMSDRAHFCPSCGRRIVP